MLTFLTKNEYKQENLNNENLFKLADAIWIDVLSPSSEEEDILERILGFRIPTRAEMAEIELSSRLYTENNILFMTAAMIANSTSSEPILDPVTFILTSKQLITVRYVEPQSFKLFTLQVKKMKRVYTDAIIVLIDLLDATIDRIADILEYIGQGMDKYSNKIFKSGDEANKLDYRVLLRQIAVNGDLNTKTQESLVTFNRLMAFLTRVAGLKMNKGSKAKIATLRKDILSLSQHTHFLSTKVGFLLDATLGLVSIEQNNIIKIFSVAAVIFLPPTLIASIYGMNFHFIPELSWKYGYLGAIGLILFAAWAPYRYFKYKKWL